MLYKAKTINYLSKKLGKIANELKSCQSFESANQKIYIHT